MAEEATKTMAVRCSPALHSKATLLAKVEKRSLGDLLIAAIESYVNERWSSDELRTQLQTALDEINQRASVERKAIESLMQPGETPTRATQPRKRGGKR